MKTESEIVTPAVAIESPAAPEVVVEIVITAAAQAAAVRLLECEHVIASSTGRHIASGRIKKEALSGVTLGDGEKRSKAEKLAFADKGAICRMMELGIIPAGEVEYAKRALKEAAAQVPA